MRKLQGLTAEIPSALRHADEVLERYGRWAMDRHKRHHCGSAEGRFKAPPNDDDRQPREMLMPTPDAMQAHRALQRVADKERIVLHILYVPHRMRPEAQLRMLRIPPSICRDRHLSGLRMFDNWLRVQLESAHLTRG
jgi:hypothetical protein